MGIGIYIQSKVKIVTEVVKEYRDPKSRGDWPSAVIAR